jgi:hypothetical protein
MTRGSVVAVSALALLASAGCEEAVFCPAVYVPDQFAIVLDRDEWRPADYRIELTYETDRGKQTDTCSVQVPFVELLETDDGGVDVELIQARDTPDAGDAGDAGMDAGVRSSEEQLCPSSRANRPGVRVSLGRAIVIRGIGHPDAVQLTVRSADELVLERDLELRYVTSYPIGRDCGSVETSQLRVELP